MTLLVSAQYPVPSSQFLREHTCIGDGAGTRPGPVHSGPGDRGYAGQTQLSLNSVWFYSTGNLSS